MIAERLASLRDRMGKAARRAGRSPDEITLIAVSKMKPAEDILAAYQAGQRHFGESYVQEFERKLPALGDMPDSVFHFIGKLQSNKTARVARLFRMVHTIDALKLARRLDQAAQPLDVLIEVKVSAEESKGGVSEDQLPELKAFVESCQNLRLRGLMGMPPWCEDAERSRPYFRRLRECAERLGLPELSMGMSHDFEVAIEEGATLIRVGTALFGRRVRQK